MECYHVLGTGSDKIGGEVNKEEILKRGYAKTIDEWWFLVDHNWSDIRNIMFRFAPTTVTMADLARKNKIAPTLHSCLTKAWLGAPDSKQIHDIPGWGTLCDLCSDMPAEEE